MVRSLCALAAALAALVFVLPASAEPTRTVVGTLTSLSSTEVTVKGHDGTMRCNVRDASPSLDGYSVGDTVQVACNRVRAGLVLAKIRHRTAAADGPASTPTPTPAPASGASSEPVRFGGAVTALSATSITLHDGDRNLTCTIAATSPSTASTHVGDHVRATCTNGVLSSLEPVTIPPVAPTTTPPAPTPPAPTPPAPKPATVGSGLISALSSTALTIHNAEHGDLTCTLTDRSPRLGDFHLGDRVQIGCTDGGVLVTIARF